MGRWFSYFSTDEILLEDAIVNPVHAITQPSRGDFQENLLNADGFGVAWYTNAWSRFDNNRVVGEPTVFGDHPVLYRATTGKPMNDTTFRYLCRSTSSKVILSHIRGSSGAVASTNNHPFVFGRSSFMHSGFIARFKDIRADMIKESYRKYSRMIGGSTDSEHLAALYFSYLDDEPDEGYFDELNQKEKKYSALSMWNALQHAVHKIEEIQLKRFGMKLNNTLNLCTTNGESFVALCYRTNPWAPSNALYASFTVGDELNRKKKESYQGKNSDMRSDEALAKAALSFKNDVEDLSSKDITEREIIHVVVATEPITFEPGDWSKMAGGQAILVEKEKSSQFLKVTLGIMPSARTSCVMHPKKELKQVIMFHNNLLALIDVSRREKAVLGRPVEISSVFGKSETTGPLQLSSGVDAVFANPENTSEMHLFGGRKYMPVEVTFDNHGALPSFKVKSGPYDISEKWTCLKGIQKFHTINAAFQVPKRPKEAWFFSNDEYVRISWTQDDEGNITSSNLEEGPTHIHVGWRSLERADFSGVNMMLPNWKKESQALVFSGNHVALVDIDPKPPKPIDTPRGRRRRVIEDWPSCFYEPSRFSAVPAFDDLGDEDTALLAHMIGPSNTKEVTFFSGSKYLVLDVSDGINTVLEGPLEISASPLGDLGDDIWTGGMDAVLPNIPKVGEVMHIFSGDKCASIIPPPSIIRRRRAETGYASADMSIRQKGKSIVERWECLKDAKFKTIDAVLEVPDCPNQVWFFSCSRYIRAEWKQQDDGEISSKMLEGYPQEITEDWIALRGAKFFQVDSVLPVAKSGNCAWFFFDDQSLLLSVKPDPKESEIMKGPKAIAEAWPTIRALFD